MKKICKYLLPLLVLGLAGCNQSSQSSSESSSSSTSSINYEIDTEIGGVYDAMLRFQEARNYTCKVDVDYDGETSTYTDFYTPNYFYTNYEGAEEGYINGETGLYKINKDLAGEFRASEVITDEDSNVVNDIWSYSSFNSFKDLNAENYKNNADSIKTKIKNKKDVLTLIKILQMDITYYTYVNECYIVLKSSSMNSVQIYISFKYVSSTSKTTEFSFNMSFFDFNVTKSEEVDTFLSNGGKASVIPTDLKRVETLFKSNNYTRKAVTNYDDATVGGYEIFTPNYYCFIPLTTDYFSAWCGYMSLPNKIKGSKEYDGTYYFLVNSDFTIAGFYDTNYAFLGTDIVSIMNYPGNMEMFNYNLQFFDDTTEENTIEAYDHSYTTTDYYLINDFIENFNLDLTTDTGASAYMHSLTILTNIYTDSKDCEVLFRFGYTVGSATNKVQYLDFPFYNFENSQIQSVEEFYATFADNTAN